MSRVSFQIIAIVVFAFTLFFVWDFSQRIVTNVRLSQTEKRLELEVAHAEATRTALGVEKKHVQTDAFVEDKVRRDWQYTREGDTLVIPKITPAPTPAPAAPLPTPIPEKPWWREVLDFLFGP